MADSSKEIDLNVQRQLTTIIYSGKRPLDFAPFEAELATFSPERLQPLVENADIVEIRQLLQDKQTTVEELALYYLYRIKNYDVDKLNSVIELNPDALINARELDAELANGNMRGLLHGIPILLKDNIGTGDNMHNTAGAKVMENAKADRDSFVATKLRQAGALLLGKTNMSEWAYFMAEDAPSGFSVLGGQVRNPYGAFDVGGSSSGSGAAIAAGFAVAALGTETSGSITSPSGHNSLVGVKPSLGLVSRDRIIPITGAQDTAGPMCRTVADAALLLSIIAGTDANDPITLDVATEAMDYTAFLDPNGLQGKRIGVVKIDPDAPDDERLERSFAIIRACGAELVKVELPEDAKVDFLDVLKYGMREDLGAYLAAVGENAPVKTLAEIIEFNKQDLPNRAPWGQAILEASQALELTPEAYAAMVADNKNRARTIIDGLMESANADLLLSTNSNFAPFYAPAGYPAITVPGGYDEHNEPKGVTFIAKFLEEPKLFAAAYAFEQASKFRRNPPGNI
jgi:amidase